MKSTSHLKNMKKYILISSILALFSFSTTNTYADATKTIIGTLKDETAKTNIPGARIKIEDGKRGTYSNGKGEFKLPLEVGDITIKITSIGYKAKTINVSDLKDSIVIYLTPEPITSKTANVIANIETDEIIRRAIAKREENNKKLKTFEGTLYSKLTVEMDGSIFSKANAQTSANSNSVSISGELGLGPDEKEQKVLDRFQMFILESFSQNYKDINKKIDKSYIQQRRQTANFKPQDNLLALSKFVNFYDDEVNIMGTNIVSPLGEDALDFYKYKLIERKVFDQRYVYVIEVIPNTKLYPTFIGKLSIVEGSYNLVDLQLEPSSETAIPFFKFLTYNQKYEEFKSGNANGSNSDEAVWFPNLLETSARAKIDIIAGFIDVGADFGITSMYNDVKINEPLPDSIYATTTLNITAAPYVDSNKIEFWERNSLREISAKELSIYNKIDSLVKSDSTQNENIEEDNFQLNFLPISDYNRVAGFEGGIDLTTKLYNTLDIITKGSYSNGQKKFYGEGGLAVNLFDNKDFKSKITAKYISQIATSNYNRPYETIVNSTFASWLKSDFYDYHQSEGISVNLESEYDFIKLNLIYQNVINDNIFRTTDWSIIDSDADNKYAWRQLDYMNENDLVDAGRYTKMIAKLDLWDNTYRNKGADISFKMGLHGMLGEEVNLKDKFNSFQAKVSLYLPLFYTGYDPISLELHSTISRASKDAPTQYLFRLPTSVGFIATDFSFLTAPLGYFGGYETQVYGAKINTSDLLWRAIGLPTYEGRGPELTLSAMTSKTFNNQEKSYISTNGQFYSEIGFGFQRIPLFISNIFYWNFDVRWSFGPIKHSSFGASLGISVPF